MLPALPQAFGNLKDVLRSAISSLSGEANSLKLPKVKNSLVVMIDGLGWHNLSEYSGHAPFLNKHLSKNSKGYSGFPSTTAASLLSLATGQAPSNHGFIGYRVFDKSNKTSVNLLTGLDISEISKYSKALRLSQVHANTVVVSRPEYHDSAFSEATFAEARFIGETEIERRFELALKELNSATGKVIYLYVPELDQTAHKFGVHSAKWIEKLELVDSQMHKLVRGVTSDRGVILTADHGIVDVAKEKHIYLDEFEELPGLIDVGGDPRATVLYFEGLADIGDLRLKLTEWLAGTASVWTVADLVDSGCYSSEVFQHENILPDLIVMPKSDWACYHRDFAKVASLQMIGQHGGLTPEEITVPVIRLAAYSSSLLVP